MELVFPNNLRSSIHIISIESVYPKRITHYLENIKILWSSIQDTQPYQNKKLFFIPHQKPISITESDNSDLMEEFSYLLHHYIQIFYQIQTLITTNSTTRQQYYIVSGCCLSSFKEVFAKVNESNKWISKHSQLTKFCHNLDYVIQYFKPDRYIYDFNTLNDILKLDTENTIVSPNPLNIKNTNIYLPEYAKHHTTNIENKEELVSILTKLFTHLNKWMDTEKKNKEVLCLDGAIFHNKSNHKEYLLAIIDFLLDN